MPKPSPTSVRIDKWLWAVRLYKTRALAADACKKGWVLIDGQPVKPSRDLRPGESVSARNEVLTRTFRAIVLLQQRVGAAVIKDYVEDLTPPEEYEKRTTPAVGSPMVRPPGSGRPTKRDRRLLHGFLDTLE